MDKKKKSPDVVWTNRKVRRRVQLLSGVSIPILSVLIIRRLIEGGLSADTAFLIGVGFGMMLTLLYFSMAPVVCVRKLEGGDAVEG